MTPMAQAFRRVAVQVCGRRGVRFAVLLEDFGLEDILEKATVEDLSAQDIAVEVLAGCCVSEGRFNNCQVGLLAVMQFLKEQLGPPGDQAFTDLVSILNGGGATTTIQRWMDTHYPEP